MKVSEIMSRDPVTIDKDRNLKDLMQLMEQHNITKIPVVDNGKLVGIVTDGRIADKLGRAHNQGTQTGTFHASSVMEKDFIRAHPDEDLANLLVDVGKPGLTMVPVCKGDQLVGIVTKADLLPLIKSNAAISSIMTKELHSVSSGERIVHARRLLLDHDIARLPVLDGGMVAGIIAEHDIATVLAGFKQADNSVQKTMIRDLTVGQAMKPFVVTAGPDTGAAAAAQMMLDHHVGALPIVDGSGTIQGIVTRTDLIQNFAS